MLPSSDVFTTDGASLTKLKGSLRGWGCTELATKLSRVPTENHKEEKEDIWSITARFIHTSYYKKIKKGRKWFCSLPGKWLRLLPQQNFAKISKLGKENDKCGVHDLNDNLSGALYFKTRNPLWSIWIKRTFCTLSLFFHFTSSSSSPVILERDKTIFRECHIFQRNKKVPFRFRTRFSIRLFSETIFFRRQWCDAQKNRARAGLKLSSFELFRVLDIELKPRLGLSKHTRELL